MQDLGTLSQDEVERYWCEHHRIAYLAEALSLERAEALFGKERIAEYRERCEALSTPLFEEARQRARG